MVLAVCKGESGTTMKADIRVDPLGCNLRIDHSRISGCEIFGRELVPYVRINKHDCHQYIQHTPSLSSAL